jgi:ribosomal protein S27AE
MTPTLIMKCPNCNGLFLAGHTQKTKICPYCGKSVNLQKALCVAQAENSLEASEFLKQLKTKIAQNPRSKL